MEMKKRLQCDVLVVGGGNAGLVAAIEARNHGRKVILIEKSPIKKRGGNSRYSGGLFRIAQEGIKDFEPLLKGVKLRDEKIEIEPYPKDAFYNKVLNLTEGLAHKQLTELFIEKSLETVTWMKEQGLVWDLNVHHSVFVDDRRLWTAGQCVLVANGLGEGLVEMLYGIAEKKGVEIRYNTAARSLIQGSDGGVCGVVAKDAEGFFQVDAPSVILASGGFGANPEMRRRYLGPNWDLVKLRGTRYNTGEGIQMALNIGAQSAGHWGICHASMVSEDSPMVEAETAGPIRYSYPFSVMVNRDGKRFADEGEDFHVFTYAKMGRKVLAEPGSVAYQIFDAKVIPFLKPEYQDAERAEANTLEELADQLGIDVEGFLATMKTYNESIVNDDAPFLRHKRDGRRTRNLNPDKTNWALKMDTPPFQGYAVVCGLTFTWGGIQTDDEARVIDTSGFPIPGFFGIGEVSGGYFYHNYPSGTGLTRGAVMGRIAGRNAANR